MIISTHDAQTFDQPGLRAVGYAAPSRGSRELSMWRLELAANEASPGHTLSHEEVFLALDGSAVAHIDGMAHPFGAGDCLVVPPGARFALTTGPQGLSAVCAMAAAGQATFLPDGPTITPPWAA